MDKDAAFLKRLLATFKVEAAEHVAAVSSGLLDLEKTPAGDRRSELIEGVFREIHSLKGAARTVNLPTIESVCRSLEAIFSILKKRDREISPDFFDLLYKALDLLRDLLSILDAEGKVPDQPLVKGLISDLDRAADIVRRQFESSINNPPISNPDAVPPIINHQSSIINPETIRVEKSKLDAVLLKAEGLLQAKQSLEERTSEQRNIIAALRHMEKRWASVGNEARTLGKFLEKGVTGDGAPRMRPPAGLLDFLESGREFIRTLKGRLSSLENKMESDRRSIGLMVDGLVEDSKRLVMTPFSTLFDFLPRTVRDLLTVQGKEAELMVSGGEVEVDRRILEEMKDPLIHLVRNSVDYGVDKPGNRILRGRPPAGRISVSAAYRDSGKVELTVADDGPGVDIANVRNSALKLGLLSPEDAERLEGERLQTLIFRSGVSTSPIVTDISGRGLGLAIVQEKVEKLGGVISLESSSETGTVFRILLPLSLATVRGLLVRLEEGLFVIPTAQVRRTMRISPDDIKTVEGRETVLFEGSTLPFIHLETILEIPLSGKRREEPSHFQAIVLEAEEKLIAFKTDEVLYEQEFLVKGLGRQLKRVRNVSGATVLGGGRVVPVLNVPDIMKSAVESPEVIASVTPRPREIEERRRLLVVEDSVTARTLLKSILEAAGYEVKTAIDGIDAYGLLRAEVFDLVVSDVDMPKMNGFELTTKIRSDKRLAELPVILVTALDSREDRERGIDVGANAYIVKSSFDQSNLLEVIKRLI